MVIEQERLKKLLTDYANNLASEDASTDDFLFEGMEFMEAITLMDEVAKIILKHVKENLK